MSSIRAHIEKRSTALAAGTYGHVASGPFSARNQPYVGSLASCDHGNRRIDRYVTRRCYLPARIAGTAQCVTIAKGGFEKAGSGRQEFPWTLDNILDETLIRVKGDMEDKIGDETCERWMNAGAKGGCCYVSNAFS